MHEWYHGIAHEKLILNPEYLLSACEKTVENIVAFRNSLWSIFRLNGGRKLREREEVYTFSLIKAYRTLR